MSEFIVASRNGRNIPREDKIFGINNRAKDMIAREGKAKVTNATVGSLLDDEGNLIVLSSVDETLKKLSPLEYADYAPIGGTPEFKEAVKKAALGSYIPKGYVEAVATPGGTGAIRNTISNYSEYGDKVLTTDWHWAPYNTIAGEIGRSIETFELFDANRNFNIFSFESKINELLNIQDHLVIILNTPAHNPTGYSLSETDWENVVSVLNKCKKHKKIALLVDVAYIDFAGDEEEYRKFLPLLENLSENVLPIIGYSMSKTYTLYGMRCGAMVCIAKTLEIAEEFKRVCEFSSRGTWSNCAKAPQAMITRIFDDEELYKKVEAERAYFRTMLLERGKAFEKAAKEVGLEILPFDSGFFVSIPCEEPDLVSRKLEEEGLFIVPLAKGLRVSIASVSEEKCRIIPKKILEAMSK
jgi:aromatic-amino-acid transaminase